MGDTAFASTLATPRALWSAPIDGEAGAPRHRIIHGHLLQLHGAAELHRLGLRRTAGYHKCGSVHDEDWVRAFRILTCDGAGWSVIRRETGCPMPGEQETIWYDLSGAVTSTLLIEARESGIDEWWTSWNLAAGAFVLDGTPSGPPAPRREATLALVGVDLRDLPNGVTAGEGAGEVRFRTRTYEVGFWLNRAAMAYLAIDADGFVSGDGGLASSHERIESDEKGLASGHGRSRNGDAASRQPAAGDRINLLRSAPGYCFQGPQLHPVGGPPLLSPSLRNAVEGSTEIHGNRVSYSFAVPAAGQRYRLTWEMLEDRLVFHAAREGDRELRVWNGSVWQFGFDATAAATHVLGPIVREGQTGLLGAPSLLHVPDSGSIRMEPAPGGDPMLLRSEAVRALDLATLEIKLGETPHPHGDYVLPAGRQEASLELRIEWPDVALHEGAPEEVARAARRCYHTALTYRADTATLSNNGVSIHCPISMDNWSAIATRMGPLLPNLEAVDLLRDSLERWLDGGPGYTSGRILQSGQMHDAEEEYTMTGAACLLGLADFLDHSGTSEWLDRFEAPIRDRIARTRALDLDDDGLIESRYRTGVSGTGQWSTCWFDVVSFGWKDAFANALLYAALTRLSGTFPNVGHPDLADGLGEWASKLRDAYLPAFLNPDTGWLAGWRCREDRLHDYGFLFANGAAVCSGVIDEETSRSVTARLWAEAQRVGLPDAYFGLPGNLHHIPDADLADIMQGYPLGFYQNGGRTHAQARHFVGALYRVGMTDEADELLRRLCAGMAHGAIFGGCRSGRDWRYWDGKPCGYEGLLTDQFGVLALALERYR